MLMPHWPLVNESASIKLGLERINNLLSLLDNPQLKLPPIIHVAGTNGKGSTLAFLRSILEELGLVVHVYTSPHLKRFNERIVVSGNEISDISLMNYLEECRIICEKNNLSVSFFEGITAAAMLAFSREKADITLLEVGLGGRLDATNVVQNPILTCITPISFDHMNVLGNSISLIAKEKAGIIKNKVPCIVSLQFQEAHKEIEQKAKEYEAPLFRFEYDYGVKKLKNGDFIFKTSEEEILFPKPGLDGDHQYINAATAIAAIKHLKNINISNQSISEGLKKVVWPGRLKKIIDGKLVRTLDSNIEIWIDGAHNEAGAFALANWLKDQEKIPSYLVMGVTKNRELGALLNHFQNCVEHVVFSDIKSEPMANRAVDLASKADKTKFPNISLAQDVEEAINKIGLLAKTNKRSRIIITGSLFLIADFLKAND